MNRPTLIILVGLPGSGKTTYAKKYIRDHENTIHLSSDLIRKELWGDEAIQGDNNQVFSLMQDMALTALNQGRNVVYDATNITRQDRSHIISKCPNFVKIEAHVIWVPVEMCIERDASRERTVGKDVIDRMIKRFHPVYYDEGINEIKIITPVSFDKGLYEDIIIDKLKIPHDNPHHSLNIYDHCHAAYDYVKSVSDDQELRWAAWLHDIGKPYTKGFVDTHGNSCEHAHFYQHHNVGSWQSYGIRNVTPLVAWLIGNHMEPFFDSKYYRNLPLYLKEKIDKLHEADLAAH